MTDFLKIAKSIVVHFAHICAYGVETVKNRLKTTFLFSAPYAPFSQSLSHITQKPLN